MLMVHGVNIFFMFNCEQVELWFSGQQDLEYPQDPDVPPVFDRQGKLKNVGDLSNRPQVSMGYSGLINHAGCW